MAYTIALGATTITLHVKEVKFGGTNDYINFVEPLTSSPTTSVYNLNQIRTNFSVKCYVKLTDIGNPSAFGSTTLFGFMLGSTLPTFSDGTTTFTVIIKSLTVSNVPERYFVRNSSTGALDECNDVEITLERAQSL